MVALYVNALCSLIILIGIAIFNYLGYSDIKNILRHYEMRISRLEVANSILEKNAGFSTEIVEEDEK